MMYNENLHEEERHLIQQIAEQTERGKIDWELTEYNPLSFLNEDKIDKNPAVIGQSFSFEAIIGGSRYELDVMENIDVPSGMGDYTRNSVVLAVYLLFSVACFFTVHEHFRRD